MKTENKYFSSSSFYLAAFLNAKGLELINIDKPESSSRAQFIFIDTPERESLVQAFNFAKIEDPSVMVDVRQYTMATKFLKEKLYQDRT